MDDNTTIALMIIILLGFLVIIIGMTQNFELARTKLTIEQNIINMTATSLMNEKAVNNVLLLISTIQNISTTEATR